MAHQVPNNSHNHIERTSPFTLSASVTVEAALAVPMFVCAVVLLMYLLEILSVRTTMKSALYSVSRQMAQEAYRNPILRTSQMEEKLVAQIGATRLARSVVAGGEDGLDCSRSHMDWSNMILELSVQYEIEIPVLLFRIPLVSCEEQVRVKAWTGYQSGLLTGIGGVDLVYVTDTGIVYHKDADCTYLELSIRPVALGSVDELQNQEGEGYHACERCARYMQATGQVYITDSGNRYHTRLSCSVLKRTVYAVPLSEVYGKGGCSRCVN